MYARCSQQSGCLVGQADVLQRVEASCKDAQLHSSQTGAACLPDMLCLSNTCITPMKTSSTLISLKETTGDLVWAVGLTPPHFCITKITRLNSHSKINDTAAVFVAARPPPHLNPISQQLSPWLPSALPSSSFLSCFLPPSIALVLVIHVTNDYISPRTPTPIKQPCVCEHQVIPSVSFSENPPASILLCVLVCACLCLYIFVGACE